MNQPSILNEIYRYAQAIHSDGLLYHSAEKNICTPERKALIQSTIKHLKAAVESYEKNIG